MDIHEGYMLKCLELAGKALGNTHPNPLVGCVIVHNNEIIGSGYHEKHGEAHAEVNAINSVANKKLLKDATLYVNLEPCSHIGKTPPCVNLILQHSIKKVVIGTPDPNPLVMGSGIKQLKDNGVEVTTGVLERKCIELNKRFITYYLKKRPYVTLKWARSADGFIGKMDGKQWKVSSEEADKHTMLFRKSEQAILVGTNTVLNDNPNLTNRLSIAQPVRVVIDKELKVKPDANIYNSEASTLILTTQGAKGDDNNKFIQLSEQDFNINGFLNALYEEGVNSVLVEGGAFTLNKFLQSGLWDEACIVSSSSKLNDGVRSPILEDHKLKKERSIQLGTDTIEYYTPVKRIEKILD